MLLNSPMSKLAVASPKQRSELQRLHDLMTETLLRANALAKSEGIDSAAFADADTKYDELAREFRNLKDDPKS
jgi:hypothetical protein